MKILAKSKFSAYWRLMRFDKPIGILLLLWPTLWALWIAADGMPSVKNLIIFVLGTVIMRAAGCVINDIADRNIDKLVTRTEKRPITSGEISVKSAVVLFLLLILLAFILVLLLNPLAIGLAVMGAMITVIYPFTKRFFCRPAICVRFCIRVGNPDGICCRIKYGATD